MKTPREILLAQHRAADQKIDAIRHNLVSELNRQETREPGSANIFVSWFLGCSKKIWDELILPSRRTWSGLAAVWLILVAINVSLHDSTPAGKILASAPVMMSLPEQQRWMNELFADRSLPVDAEPPKTFSPKPRTQTVKSFIA